MTSNCKKMPIKLMDEDSEKLDFMSSSLKLSTEFGPLLLLRSCSENSEECLAELSGPKAPCAIIGVDGALKLKGNLSFNWIIMSKKLVKFKYSNSCKDSNLLRILYGMLEEDISDKLENLPKYLLTSAITSSVRMLLSNISIKTKMLATVSYDWNKIKKTGIKKISWCFLRPPSDNDFM